MFPPTNLPENLENFQNYQKLAPCGYFEAVFLPDREVWVGCGNIVICSPKYPLHEYDIIFGWDRKPDSEELTPQNL